MTVMTDENGNIFLEFIEIEETELEGTSLDAPLTHALIVVQHQQKYLFMFNKWRNNWELPGGVIEQGESARQCVIRELFEETNQKVEGLKLNGLMKFKLQPSFHGPERIEYGALFSGDIVQLETFTENEEAASIVFWDGVSDIGRISGIDKKLIAFA